MLRKVSLSLLSFGAVLLTAGSAFAEGGEGAGGGLLIAIGVGLGIGLAAFAGALGQGRVAAATLEGIARNPNAADKLFVPMILGLAFIESLVLFTWVLMLLMQLKM